MITKLTKQKKARGINFMKLALYEVINAITPANNLNGNRKFKNTLSEIFPQIVTSKSL